MPKQNNTQSRNRDLALIHIGAKDRGMYPHDKDPDSSYRFMLWSVAHVRSAGDLDAEGRQAVIYHLKKLGWKPTSRSPKDRQSGLIRHIWNRLVDAGVVRHKDGIGAWLQHNTRRAHPQKTGWQKPEFLPAQVKRRVIEQLKEWAGREKVEWK